MEQGEGRQYEKSEIATYGDYREVSLQQLLRVSWEREQGGAPLKQWFSVRANFASSTSGDNCQCLQTFLIVTTKEERIATGM